MSLAVWPADLPKPQRDGFQVQIADPRKRKAAETGPPGYRRRWSSVARNVALSIDVTRSGKAVFDTFYDDETRMGSLPFQMPDPLTDGWALLDATGKAVLTEEGAPILLSEQWLCLFGDETPVQSARGNRFVIAFSVTVMP